VSRLWWILGGVLAVGAAKGGSFVLSSVRASRFAQAIAKAEGFGIPSAIPTRANNPGDLKLPGASPLPGTSITMFATVAEGWQALERQLMLIATGQSAFYRPTMTIAEMAKVWTATEQDAWARNVAASLGVSTNTQIGALL
jgi:hypothetical protein